MITVYFQSPSDWAGAARRLVEEKGDILIPAEAPLEFLDGIILAAVELGEDVVFVSRQTGNKISLDDMRKLRSEMGIDPRMGM